MEYFSWSREPCNTVLPRSSINVLWTTKLHLPLPQHEGGRMILGEQKINLTVWKAGSSEKLERQGKKRITKEKKILNVLG